MTVQIFHGDCRLLLKTLDSGSVNCCVTSPPYFGLRDYGVDGQIGLEATPEAFVDQLISVFRDVRRVLRDDGTLWLNLGDSYAYGGRGGNPTEATSGLEGGQATQRDPLYGAQNRRDFRKTVPGRKSRSVARAAVYLAI
jgi:DNA modification methylase